MAIQTWEYRVLTGAPSQRQLDDLGRDGWELVSVSYGPDGGPATYLKRPALGFKEQVTLEQREKYARLRGDTLEG